MAQVLRQEMQPEFDYEHKLCSGCLIKHRVLEGACEGCFWKRCPACRLWNRITSDGRVACANPHCRARYELTREELRAATHRPDMTHCNVCGKKLRAAPRDKRRGRGEKE